MSTKSMARRGFIKTIVTGGAAIGALGPGKLLASNVGSSMAGAAVGAWPGGRLLADASGAMLTRYPAGLASALKKIAADTEPLEAANKATAHLYIVNPLKDIGGTVNKLFSTHPPIEERIAALEKM